MKTCHDCDHCRCRIDLIPGERKFYAENPALMDFLNSEPQFAEVWCRKKMWLTQSGEEFVYTSLERLPTDSPRVQTAQSCPYYSG